MGNGRKVTNHLSSVPVFSGYSLDRRQLLGGLSFGLGALTLTSLPVSPALAASGELTVAVPNNPTTMDPTTQANHDAMVITQSIFEILFKSTLTATYNRSSRQLCPIYRQMGWSMFLPCGRMSNFITARCFPRKTSNIHSTTC